MCNAIKKKYLTFCRLFVKISRLVKDMFWRENHDVTSGTRVMLSQSTFSTVVVEFQSQRVQRLTLTRRNSNFLGLKRLKVFYYSPFTGILANRLVFHPKSHACILTGFLYSIPGYGPFRNRQCC